MYSVYFWIYAHEDHIRCIHIQRERDHISCVYKYIEYIYNVKYYNIIQNHTASYDIKQHHTIPYNIIQHQTIPYNIIQYHTISKHIIRYHTISYHIKQYQAISKISDTMIQYCTLSKIIIQDHIVSIISYHITSYHKSFSTIYKSQKRNYIVLYRIENNTIQ